MPRKRPETKRRKIAKMLIEEYQPQSAQDIKGALKDLLGDTMDELLKAELDEHLDYGDGEKPLSLNTRNGTSKKTVRLSYGNIDSKYSFTTFILNSVPYFAIKKLTSFS